MIAVIDCRNRHNDMPDTIDVYSDSQSGRETSRQQFLELVAEDLAEAEQLSEEEALKKAEDYLNPAGSTYAVGEGYIALIESGVTFHSE